MALSKEQKLQAIEDRRSGPEARLYGAQLDLDTAKAAGNETAAQEAQSRIDAEKAQLEALDKAEAALK
jgi:hypothetical protein